MEVSAFSKCFLIFFKFPCCTHENKEWEKQIERKRHLLLLVFNFCLRLRHRKKVIPIARIVTTLAGTTINATITALDMAPSLTSSDIVPSSVLSVCAPLLEPEPESVSLSERQEDL